MEVEDLVEATVAAARIGRSEELEALETKDRVESEPVRLLAALRLRRTDIFDSLGGGRTKRSESVWWS